MLLRICSAVSGRNALLRAFRFGAAIYVRATTLCRMNPSLRLGTVYLTHAVPVLTLVGMKTDLASPRFTNDDAARMHLEGIRWPNGPVCPHCGALEKSSRIAGGRDGLLFCNACRMQYTVTVGTVFERSKIALHKWLLANHLLNASKKGMSSLQLSRMLGVSYKTAWFMSHRIRLITYRRTDGAANA